MINLPNSRKNISRTSSKAQNKDQGNNNNPTISRNPYAILGAIEGVEREYGI